MFEFRFASLGDFLAMGGHAGFVWGSYLAFALVVVWNFWQPRMERRRVVRLLHARQDRQPQQSAISVAIHSQQGAQQQQGEAD